MSESQTPRRVSASAIAAMLAADSWKPLHKEARNRSMRKAKKIAKVSGGTQKRLVVDRESAEALPPGHPVSWNALWGADRVPQFPVLAPMGASAIWESIH